MNDRNQTGAAVRSSESRMARVDSLTVGDFIEVYDGYGEVVRIRGPHGPLGTPLTTDWYTLQVVFDDPACTHRRPSSTVGPKRGAEEVACVGLPETRNE